MCMDVNVYVCVSTTANELLVFHVRLALHRNVGDVVGGDEREGYGDHERDGGGLVRRQNRCLGERVAAHLE